MIREELEFRIARYADGTLPPAQRAAVEAELAADGAARALLAEYRQLDRVTAEAARQPLPPVRWDRLAEHLSAVVAGAAASAPAPQPAAPLDEQTEFFIACYADGTLADERRDEVEQLLAADERARASLEAYQDLNATLKAAAYDAPFPAIRWDRLASHLGESVSAAAGATLTEAFERQVAEYAQGALAAGEREEVEARLASEPAARVALSEYRNLDAALQALPTIAPLPSVDWGQLAGRISAAVDAAVADGAAAVAEPSLRIAPEAAKARRGRSEGGRDSYPIWSWVRSPMSWAAAASVLIAAGVGARLLRHSTPLPKSTPEPQSVAEVAPLAPEQSAGSAVAEVQVGPPKALAQGGDTGPDDADDGVVSSPARAFVASGLPAPKEPDVLPAMPF